MDNIDKSIMFSLEIIRDICQERENCAGCPYACKYYVKKLDEKRTVYACVLNEMPERWQLETMEGVYNGQ